MAQKINSKQIPVKFTRLLGVSTYTSGGVIPVGFTTYCTITATTLGGPILIQYNVNLNDGNSGSDRTGSVKVQLDGADVAGSGLGWKTKAITSAHPSLSVYGGTPAAGSHTWTLQVQANTASANVIDASSLVVFETSA